MYKINLDLFITCKNLFSFGKDKAFWYLKLKSLKVELSVQAT